ncbi:4Fe-4S binding protein [Oscillospiraceae bacterium HV4-5-C5C]|nr:4Fe-4S binding protein [Oscillospiraceae bacterium HV4-5-C5C]
MSETTITQAEVRPLTLAENPFTALREWAAQHRPVLDQRLARRTDVVPDGRYYKLSGPFYSRQTRIVLRNCEITDPLQIADYIALDGYEALARTLEQMASQSQMVADMRAANLRGRGGAGFNTGRKWAEALKHDARHKYVICNADEGDPGAYMDRSLLENDPHAVLEGMALAGYAIGADHGFIYVRAEYPTAVKRLKIAIAQAEACGLLGEHILGSDFSFKIELRLGAGAFVCGEGTALMESIEGRRGMPRVKEYRTAEKGLFGYPTVINNVETLGNVHWIYLNGWQWFHDIGTEDSSGTKVFALVGKIQNAGLVEVPMGTTLREIVYDIGGGVREGGQLKAVQTGGPSGGCIPADMIDIPVDFGSLARVGSIMGSGGMVILDDTDCMVDIARFFMEFTVDESCGKCTPCRVGNKRVLEILNRITKGQGSLQDLSYLEELCEVIRDTSLCGLGQAAPNPVLSTLQYFRAEYLEHIEHKHCPAGVCRSLLNYEITDACVGCGLCTRKCPTGCISGEKKQQHHIDQSHCVKCGTCIQVCPVHAIERH